MEQHVHNCGTEKAISEQQNSFLEGKEPFGKTRLKKN